MGATASLQNQEWATLTVAEAVRNAVEAFARAEHLIVTTCTNPWDGFDFHTPEGGQSRLTFSRHREHPATVQANIYRDPDTPEGVYLDNVDQGVAPHLAATVIITFLWPTQVIDAAADQVTPDQLCSVCELASVWLACSPDGLCGRCRNVLYAGREAS